MEEAPPAVLSAGVICYTKRHCFRAGVLISQKKKRKDAAHFVGMQDYYREFISGIELLTVPSSVATRTVSLLATDVKTRKLVGVSRKVMEEEQSAKALRKKSNAVYDILMSSKEATEKLSGSIFTIKSMRMQTEYMSTWKIKNYVSMEITDDRLGGYFSQYGRVEDVTSIPSKAGIVTGDYKGHVMVTRKSFLDIPDTLLCCQSRVI